MGLWHNLTEPLCRRPGRLHRALLTTYGCPDFRFIARRLLPRWLGIDTDPEDQPIYDVALCDRLGCGEGHSGETPIEIIYGRGRLGDARTSPSRYQACFGLYETSEVQHAKLWMFHRIHDTPPQHTLELCISSCNLTEALFQTQIQAAWRCVVEWDRPASHSQLDTWGVLPTFIKELIGATACRNPIAKYWSDLLKQVEPPSGVQFVASVPGEHRKGVWGIDGLARCIDNNWESQTVVISAPYLGQHLTDEWIDGWAAKARCGSPRLAWPATDTWPDQQAAWSRTGDAAQQWAMTRQTCDTLVNRSCVMPIAPVTNEEREAIGRRWSHAKLYGFKKGMARRLLLTSANFSPSAWGDRNTHNGPLTITNFELGVLLEDGCDWSTIPWLNITSTALTDNIRITEPRTRATRLTATWNGTHISITYKLKHKPRKIIQIHYAQGGSDKSRTLTVLWQRRRRRREWLASVVWRERDGLPLVCHIDDRDVVILDGRDAGGRNITERNNVILSALGVARTQLTEYREDCYAARFGAKRQDDTRDGDNSFNTSPGNRDGGDQRGESPADYSVPAVMVAQEWFAIIDKWHEALITNTRDSKHVLRDGQRLLIGWLERQRVKQKERYGRDEGIDAAFKVVSWEINQIVRPAPRGKRR